MKELCKIYRPSTQLSVQNTELEPQVYDSQEGILMIDRILR